MGKGTIVFVHGTGVRLAAYTSGFAKAQAAAKDAGLAVPFADCAWGDAFGAQFEGLSLPGPVSAQRAQAEGEDLARWSWLFYDPLAELDRLTIRTTNGDAGDWGDDANAWQAAWTSIEQYRPDADLDALLARGALTSFWPDAWSAIVVRSPVARKAFQASAGELPEAREALARALVAQLHLNASAAGQPGPSRALRDSLVKRLIIDWGDVLAPSDFLQRFIKRAATSILKRNRYALSEAAAAPLGDILLYQARGADIRAFIRAKIMAAAPPVTVIAHSLGAIACFDLLAGAPELKVHRLVTVGTQIGLLHELGALASLPQGAALPPHFPPWLNIYDQDDFLSYLAAPLFGRVEDVEAGSGQPFPDSHSAYFANDQVWNRIRDFL